MSGCTPKCFADVDNSKCTSFSAFLVNQENISCGCYRLVNIQLDAFGTCLQNRFHEQPMGVKRKQCPPEIWARKCSQVELPPQTNSQAASWGKNIKKHWQQHRRHKTFPSTSPPYPAPTPFWLKSLSGEMIVVFRHTHKNKLANKRSLPCHRDDSNCPWCKPVRVDKILAKARSDSTSQLKGGIYTEIGALSRRGSEWLKSTTREELPIISIRKTVPGRA